MDSGGGGARLISQGGDRMKRVSLLMALTCGLNATANAQWADLWSTPEQRAAGAYEAGDHESLLNNAPDGNWTGLGQFQAGDFDEASKTFSEQAINEQLNGDSDAINRALYNQGVSDVMAGRYDEALSNFDSVLSSDPDFVDAVHNREITQQLIEQQQQEQQQGEEGEQGDEGEQSDEGDQSQESGDQQDSQDGEQSDESSQSDEQPEGQQDSEQNSEQSAGSEGDEEEASDSESDSDEQQAAEDARQALAAEAQQGEEQEGVDAEQSETEGSTFEERPLSESEQATEQWLRRIPDDPAGLLRRKLEQSHRNEYPEVRDAIKPW